MTGQTTARGAGGAEMVSGHIRVYSDCQADFTYVDEEGTVHSQEQARMGTNKTFLTPKNALIYFKAYYLGSPNETVAREEGEIVKLESFSLYQATGDFELSARL